MRPTTNFAAFDDVTLLWMLHRGAPETVADIAAAWGMIAVSLQERAQDIELEYRKLRPTWVGESADQYERSITSVIRAIRKVSEMAMLVRDVVYHSAEALAQARSMFPLPLGFDPAQDAPAQLVSVDSVSSVPTVAPAPCTAPSPLSRATTPVGTVPGTDDQSTTSTWQGAR